MSTDFPVVIPTAETHPEFFSDKTPYVKQALAEFLRLNHLPRLHFLELSSADQSRVLARAAAFESRRKTSSGHEGCVE